MRAAILAFLAVSNAVVFSGCWMLRVNKPTQPPPVLAPVADGGYNVTFLGNKPTDYEMWVCRLPKGSNDMACIEYRSFVEQMEKQ